MWICPEQRTYKSRISRLLSKWHGLYLLHLHFLRQGVEDWLSIFRDQRLLVSISTVIHKRFRDGISIISLSCLTIIQNSSKWGFNRIWWWWRGEGLRDRGSELPVRCTNPGSFPEQQLAVEPLSCFKWYHLGTNKAWTTHIQIEWSSSWFLFKFYDEYPRPFHSRTPPPLLNLIKNKEGKKTFVTLKLPPAL